jgi:hypothetical protein
LNLEVFGGRAEPSAAGYGVRTVDSILQAQGEKPHEILKRLSAQVSQGREKIVV